MAVTIPYVHNTQSSQGHGNFGEQFGQHVEPHGRYLIERSGDHVPEGWESGEVTFHNPKHMDFGGGYTDPSNWKHRLSAEYGGKRGKTLSRALLKAGHDGIITHDERGAREIVDLTPLRRQARAVLPSARLFGPTYGLDKRLFVGDELRPEIRRDIVGKFSDFCAAHEYPNWSDWAKIVFFGSEASTWTSKDLIGNSDFDLSIGIEYSRFRAAVPKAQAVSDELIANTLTEEMHAELNDPDTYFELADGSRVGPMDETWFANLLGWDITQIRPYAAYDVVTGQWIVKPPDLPEWDLSKFPEGHGLTREIQGVIEMARGILAMPEPYRTQQGSALWTYIHSNRSDAFGEQGEGWWDARNVLEKSLDQKSLMQPLFDCHARAVADPHTLDAPAGWSNDPSTVQS
jgi:hypothetical protein